LEKGLPFLKYICLCTGYQIVSQSNGLLYKLLCLESFPKLVALDMHGFDVSDLEFQQIINDISLDQSAERNFQKLQVKFPGCENRELYLAFMKQAVHSFNISPDGLHLPKSLRNLKRVQAAFKKMEAKINSQ
jgi:hypothetical protein